MITRPYAKSLLFDTSDSQVFVRPTKVDSRTGLYLHFGGRGRTVISPNVSIKRTSYWEDYTNHRQRRPLMWMAWEPSTPPPLEAAILKLPKSWFWSRGRSKCNRNHRAPMNGDAFSGALKNGILPIGYPFDERRE